MILHLLLFRYKSHFICQSQNFKTCFTDLLVAGGTPNNGGTKVVQSRTVSEAGSASSAHSGRQIVVSKAAPGRTFFDDVFNVSSCFLYLDLFLITNLSSLLPPLLLDLNVSLFPIFSLVLLSPFPSLFVLSPYFLYSSPITTFSSFLSFSYRILSITPTSSHTPLFFLIRPINSND